MTSLDKIKSLLGRTIRVRISDGRVIEGVFQCFDKDLNFILGSAVENHGIAPGRNTLRVSLA